MATVYKRAGAKRDLVEDYVYLAGHAGIETAERFLSSADESFRDLARHPGMGTCACCMSHRTGGAFLDSYKDLELALHRTIQKLLSNPREGQCHEKDRRQGSDHARRVPGLSGSS